MSNIPNPPELRGKTISMFGRTITDPFSDLRDDDWAKGIKKQHVLDYINLENNYTDHIFEPHNNAEKTLFEELKSRIPGDDNSVPVVKEQYTYYTKYCDGDQYPIFIRYLNDHPEKEEIILDINQCAKEQTFFQLGSASISKDHTMLAYSYDIEGNEQYVIVVKDLASGNMLKDKADWNQWCNYLAYE